MTTTELRRMAQMLVAGGKGLLAADETVPSLTRRLGSRRIQSTPESRRDYRELFFSAAGIESFIRGVILHVETLRQTSAAGAPLIDVLAARGIVPGIKVDVGTAPLSGYPGESISEGLDGLADRLVEYREAGARFAKWRAVFAMSPTSPSATCIQANAQLMARFAALSQEQGLVPVIEPEVLMDGAHTLERCGDVTGQVLQLVFGAPYEHRVLLEALLLKPNMVMAGLRCAYRPGDCEVASATIRCLQRHVPVAVPGIVFLSGGQDYLAATVHLSAINRIEAAKPWKLSFSYGRPLQDEALGLWNGKSDNIAAAQRAFCHRARCVSAAALGRYTTAMEHESAVA